MPLTYDEMLEPLAPGFGLGRDLPLSFQARTEPCAIAALGLPPAPTPRHKDARNALLTAAVLADQRNSWVSFSRRPSFYVGRNRYHGDTFRYDLVLKAVADGVAAGLLEEDRALPGSRGFQSRFRATPLLCEQLKEQPIRTVVHEVIWLRDNKGRPVSYSDTATTQRMRRKVQAVNVAMADVAIDLPDVQKKGAHWVLPDRYVLPSQPSVRRVFNRGSFEKGGRLYGWFQNLPVADRARLLMNGQPVLEPDFCQLHAQIIYALRGIPLVGDAYETGEFPRRLGKRAFNIGVNARSFPTAVAALAHDQRIDRQTAAKVISCVKAKHSQVSDIFCSDAGVSLMKIDAEITLSAIQRCQAQGIAVLPVHDSLVVPAADAERTAEIMKATFEQRFPKSGPCEVRIKKPLPQDGKDCGERASERLAA
jgi:hypothetical protein